VNLEEALTEGQDFVRACSGLGDHREVRLAAASANDRTVISLGALRVLTEAAALGEANWNLVAAIKRREDAERDFEVTGRDTVMYCLAHRRKVTWMPAPGWWIHADKEGRLPLDLLDGHPGDPRGCASMWNAPAPITVTRRTSS